jgi:hypothetical protein
MKSEHQPIKMHDQNTASCDKGICPLIELYRIFVETMDRTNDRRASTNQFFLTIHSIFLAGSGYLLQAGEIAKSFEPLTVFFVAAVLMCILWWILLFSYRNTNRVKFELIHEVERKFPFQPFTREWERLGKGLSLWKHIPFTNIELFIPWVFILLYIATWFWAKNSCSILSPS